jgi:hypothetical protein
MKSTRTVEAIRAALDGLNAEIATLKAMPANRTFDINDPHYVAKLKLSSLPDLYAELAYAEAQAAKDKAFSARTSKSVKALTAISEGASYNKAFLRSLFGTDTISADQARQMLAAYK